MILTHTSDIPQIFHVSETPIGSVVRIVEWGHHKHYLGLTMERRENGDLYAYERWPHTHVGNLLWTDSEVKYFAKSPSHSNLRVEYV